MKLRISILKFLSKAATSGFVWLTLCGVLGAARMAAQTAPAPADARPIQAIQQAPDPSAAVSAYAAGMALNSSDPKLYAAYVARMVDFGMPELAYHQAKMLTTLQSDNGLAWGVVAYVEARRGKMGDAISAINLAGELAPGNKFVARTAGELLAWYDLRADKTRISEIARQGLEEMRPMVAKQPAFTMAYDTAVKAYKGQTQVVPGQYAPAPQVSGGPPGLEAPVPPPPPPISAQSDMIAPLGYTPPPAPPTPYPEDYADGYYGAEPDYYDWGPGWIAPEPWCWWEPCGFWGGCGFFPIGSVCLFGGFDHFHGGGFHHGGGFGPGDHWGGHGGFGPGGNPVDWHNGPGGAGGFFGTPARPSGAVTQMARQDWQEHTGLNIAGQGPHWRAEFAAPGEFARIRPEGGVSSYRAPAYSAPHWASSEGGRFGGFRAAQIPHFGSFHAVGPSGGGFHSGGFHVGGGFHGGGFGGGFHGGGGGGGHR